MAFDPGTFDVGPVSVAAARLLSGAVAAYAALTWVYAYRGVERRLEDRWSAIACTAVLAALAVLLWTDGAHVLPAPFSVGLVLVYVGAIAFTLTYTLGRYKERIEKFRHEAGARLAALLHDVLPEERYEEWLRLRDKFRLDPEQRRKAPHLMMGIFLAIYGALGYLILRPFWSVALGGEPLGGGEGIQNLWAATHNGWLVAGHTLSLFGLMLLLFVLAPTELLRLRFPELSYPFKTTILTRLRKREAGLFGAHFYIAAAVPLAAVWLTRDPADWPTAIPAVVAVLAVTIFADAASALVGIRWGRRKWFHHPGKTYLGTVGGALVAVAVSAPFVGPAMAVVSGLVFAFIDAIGPVPVQVSDNILNPVALAVAYTVGWAWMDPMIPFY